MDNCGEEITFIMEMRAMERAFRRSVGQLNLVKNKVHAVMTRYNRAVKNDQKSLRMNYRLQLLTIEGVQSMYWHYSRALADRLDEMEEELLVKFDIEWHDVAE